MNPLLNESDILDVPIADDDQSDQKILVEFQMPSEVMNYTPPAGFVLVGNYHIQKNAPFVIGGAPGVGKSRAVVALAVAGATQQDWFGLKIHRPFKTMILQMENGRVRLKNEFSEINCPGLDEFVRICPPPLLGFAFDLRAFRDQLRREIDIFQPDVFILDPFNRLAHDDKAKDYKEAFEALINALPTGDDAPALGIVAHTRKPKDEERASGRNALNMLAGSYLLGSVPRAVFVMQAASDETTENRVIWICCKNNDGELGSPSVWERSNGIFRPIENFDWNEFNDPGERRKTITEADISALFENGSRKITKNQAVQYLMEQTGCKQAAAYNALSLTGRFQNHLAQDENKLLFLKP